MMKYIPSTKTNVLHFVAACLDFGLVPYLIYLAWNYTFPNFIDFVHEINIKQAYILFYMFAFIRTQMQFTSHSYYKEYEERVNWMVSTICDAINSKKEVNVEP